jgi:hypothetical protein
MTLTHQQVRELVARFKSSVAGDLYSSADIVDFEAAMTAVKEHEGEISALEEFLQSGVPHSIGLSQVLVAHPRLYGVLCSLLSINGSIELEDGRSLFGPEMPPRTVEAARMTADVLLELGLSRLLADKVDVRRLFLVVQIAADAPRRRFRVDAKIKSRVGLAIQKAIDAAKSESNKQLEIGSRTMLPSTARGVAEYVVTADGKPRIAVATTFQTYSGGRQTREMGSLYPSIQASLAGSGISLVIIADGRGMRRLSDRVLLELFTVVPYTMTLSQAEDGGLKNAFVVLTAQPLEKTVDTAGLQRLIESTLESRTSVLASSLPVSVASGRLALANYASANNQLALRLAPGGMELRWEHAELVDCFRRMRWAFDGPTAIRNFIQLLGGSETANLELIDLANAVATLPDDPVFVLPFVVAASSGGAEVELLRELSRHALQISPESRVAVLLVVEPLSQSTLSKLRDVQSFLPVTIVVVDMGTCISMALSREPARDQIRALMLEQTDLTKLSPFVVRGVTPSRVFFGREEEEAALLSTLPTNSVALLGARRIGKTSLMRHSFGRLRAANLRPFFGDCQVVRTWADFGEMASRNWKIDLPPDFKPQHLFELVDKLSDGSDRSTVVLLDEIDQLLDWDAEHTEDEVPEAFFRACRSISQQGMAQFVFSGERIIANRMWDARSPHWNFCRPLMLRQLTRPAAFSLMAEPLEALGVRIDDRDPFLTGCWNSTDGHPELLQQLGDRIVGLINQRDRTDIFTSPADVLQITSQFEYAEQYLETYWGQATALERVVSILLHEGPQTVEYLMNTVEALAPTTSVDDVRRALHMLELYGIAEQSEAGYELRALWFTAALPFYGGPEIAMSRYIEMLRK